MCQLHIFLQLLDKIFRVSPGAVLGPSHTNYKLEHAPSIYVRQGMSGHVAVARLQITPLVIRRDTRSRRNDWHGVSASDSTVAQWSSYGKESIESCFFCARFFFQSFSHKIEVRDNQLWKLTLCRSQLMLIARLAPHKLLAPEDPLSLLFLIDQKLRNHKFCA